MNAEPDPELRAAEEAAIVEETVGLIRHDLRNRLAAIRQAAYYLRMKSSGTELFQSDPRFPKFFSLIEDQIVLADADLSTGEAFTKVYARNSSETTSERVLERALADLPPDTIGRATAQPTDLLVSEAEVALALRHLVKNAIESGAGPVEVSGALSENQYAFRVSNPGVPLDPKRLAQLVKPFVSERGKRGLGLAIARRIADRHCGGLRVGKDESKGAATSIELYLPVPSVQGQS